MKAIILAAGRGTRISRYLGGNPKCTVDIGEETLIHYTVDLLNRYGITEIALSVGYKQEVIRKELAAFDIRYFFNPFFDVTNSIASIWFAKSFITPDNDYLIMNGDVFMDKAILEQALSNKLTPVLFSDETRVTEADYKFQYQDGILKKYGRELSAEETTGEYVGLGVVGKRFVPKFLDQLNVMIDNQQHSVWWENILYSLIEEKNIFVQDVKGEFWAEVDYIEDYQRILKHKGVTQDPLEHRGK